MCVCVGWKEAEKEGINEKTMTYLCSLAHGPLPLGMGQPTLPILKLNEWPDLLRIFLKSSTPSQYLLV